MISFVVWAFTLGGCVMSAEDASDAVNTRPILGVLAQSTDLKLNSLGDTYIASSYVKWLQSAGARVVPIRVKENCEYYKKVFRGINGIVFPGGDVNILKSHYAEAAKLLYNMALRSNDEGHFFPLWGTCQGFELLTALTSGENVLAHRHVKGMLPLHLTADYKKSRLFKKIPSDLLNALTTQNVTANHHNWGLTSTNYTKNTKLRDFYRVLSTDIADDKKEFISTFEAYKYPFYGVQWHPEKNTYDWSLKDSINHDAIAVRVSQYFANFIVAESRKSYHRFDSLEEELSMLIDNYQPVFSKDVTFKNTYYFNFTSRANVYCHF